MTDRMAQKSRTVTIVDGVEIMEVTKYDLDNDPVETAYYVQGERCGTLREARNMAARAASEPK